MESKYRDIDIVRGLVTNSIEAVGVPPQHPSGDAPAARNADTPLDPFDSPPGLSKGAAPFARTGE